MKKSGRAWLGIVVGGLVVGLATAEGAIRDVVIGHNYPDPGGGWTLLRGDESTGGDADLVGYHRVPYAEPPVGANAFRKTVPGQHSNGPVDTRSSVQGASDCACIQLPASDGTIAGHTDCLYLTLYRPNTQYDGAAYRYTDALPVAVWLHGGAMITGDSAAQITMLKNLAREGFVVVGVNYRLGMAGFAAHIASDTAGNGLLADDGQPGTSGNYALWDMQEALRWVQEHIARFGGDPAQISIFGESAGAYGVLAQAASPRNSVPFRSVIQQSAPTWASPEIGEQRQVHQSYLELTEIDITPTVANDPANTIANPCHPSEVANPLECLRGLSLSDPDWFKAWMAAITWAFEEHQEVAALYGAIDREASGDAAFLPDSLNQLLADNFRYPLLSFCNEHEASFYALELYRKLYAFGPIHETYGPDDVGLALSLPKATFDAYFMAEPSVYAEALASVSSLDDAALTANYILSDLLICVWHDRLPGIVEGAGSLAVRSRSDEAIDYWDANEWLFRLLFVVPLVNEGYPEPSQEMVDSIILTAGHGFELFLMNQDSTLHAQEQDLGMLMIQAWASFMSNPWGSAFFDPDNVTVFENWRDIGSNTKKRAYSWSDGFGMHEGCELFESAGMLADEHLYQILFPSFDAAALGYGMDPPPSDADGDGYPSDVDCNDMEPTIYPGAVEICGDAIDNDCDGEVDEGCSDPPPCTDADGDGWCVEDNDCDDSNPDVHPGHPDKGGRWGRDGLDNDCNGVIDG